MWSALVIHSLSVSAGSGQPRVKLSGPVLGDTVTWAKLFGPFVSLWMLNMECRKFKIHFSSFSYSCETILHINEVNAESPSCMI